MGQVVELFKEAAFDTEAVAKKSLHDRGQQPALVEEVIARRIIACAKRGERNPDRLCEEALSALGGGFNRSLQHIR